jgi:3alpha(or 20beta)-hydroxysteroid dehydrogenase
VIAAAPWPPLVGGRARRKSRRDGIDDTPFEELSEAGDWPENKKLGGLQMSAQLTLKDKVAIITGAAGGMGATAARLFAAEGANVVVTDMNPEGAALAEELGDQALFMQHDVSDELDWSQVVTTTLQRFGRLDILVNNAGVFRPGTLQDTERSTLDLLYKVNQLSVFLGMNAVRGAMASAGGGSIINLSSCVAMRGVAGQFAYSASKWAVRGMTKCAALDLASLGIRVNSIHPGPTDTPMLNAYSAEQKAGLAAMIPLGRLGKPTDVAQVMAFLASNAASYISGAEIAVDGAVFA